MSCTQLVFCYILKFVFFFFFLVYLPAYDIFLQLFLRHSFFLIYPLAITFTAFATFKEHPSVDTLLTACFLANKSFCLFSVPLSFHGAHYTTTLPLYKKSVDPSAALDRVRFLEFDVLDNVHSPPCQAFQQHCGGTFSCSFSFLFFFSFFVFPTYHGSATLSVLHFLMEVAEVPIGWEHSHGTSPQLPCYLTQIGTQPCEAHAHFSHL